MTPKDQKDLTEFLSRCSAGPTPSHIAGVIKRVLEELLEANAEIALLKSSADQLTKQRDVIKEVLESKLREAQVELTALRTIAVAVEHGLKSGLNDKCQISFEENLKRCVAAWRSLPAAGEG